MKTTTPHSVSILILVLSQLLLYSCASPGPAPEPQTTPYQTHSISILEKLLHHHDEWQGTPYRLGGLSKQGIDCSGFVWLTYRQLFNVKTHRTTLDLSTQGLPINKDQLQTGDLVFFKHHNGVRHVGMYLGKQEFLHASTSKGVTISRLNNRYWQKRYWQARRLLK